MCVSTSTFAIFRHKLNKFKYLNLKTLEVVPHYHEPQLQVGNKLLEFV